MGILLSVLICTHNPQRERFCRVLDGLKEQSLPQEQWELIVIDSKSTESLAGAWDLGWHPHGAIIREEIGGLSNARLRGLAEAQGEVMVFVDDDNVVAPDYLEAALAIAQEWPNLGVWGGSIIGEFEAEPSPEMRDFLPYLAVREVKTAQWSNVASCQEAEPWGAGLCLRRAVALEYRKFYEQSEVRLGDRESGALLSGGDTEIAYVACAKGWGMGVFPSLRVTHLISSERVSEDYLVRLAEGLNASSMLLQYKWRAVAPRPARWSTMRYLKHLLFNRGLSRKMAFAHLRAEAYARKVCVPPSRS